jgi:hypothetical protein
MDIQAGVNKWSPFGVGNKRERIIVLVSAVVGIVAFFLLLKRSKAAAASSDTSSYGLGDDTGTAIDLAGTPNVSGIGGSSGGYIVPSGTDPTTNPVASTPIPAGPNFNLAYTQDTGVGVSSDLESASSFASSSGGGFNIGVGKLSLGGNKSSSSSGSSSSKALAAITATEQFQAQTSIENADPSSIAGLETFLERVGGSAEQRMDMQKQVLATSSEVVGTLVGRPIGTLTPSTPTKPSIPPNYAGNVAQPTP